MTVALAAKPNRGATIKFATTFYDVNGVVSQPAGGIMNIVYPDSTGAEQTVQLTMTPPSDPSADPRWTALFDTRSIGPGVLFYSVHSVNSPDDIPFAVGDGRLTIDANAANLPTF